MTRHFYQLTCINCKRKTSERETTSLCPSCDGPLDLVYDFDYLRNHLNPYVLRKAPPKVAKYLSLTPLINRDQIVSLEEGGTPLHLAKNLGKKFGLTNLFIKNEGLNPTGAFKDRGSFVEINKARELGFKTVAIASTGNMAASVAAYSVQAGMTCYVFVPDTTPRGKLAQCLSYGANVVKIRGTYAEATEIASKTAYRYGFYLAGDYVFRLEGQKTSAYEMVEQSFFKPIDWVFVPIGMGTNLAAIWKGFNDYHKLGFLKRFPRMVGVQAKGCQPVVRAFKRKSRLIPVKKPQTVASAIAVGKPIDAKKTLTAIRASNGLAIAVSDDQTLQAQQTLAKLEGIYVEPAAATTIAAVTLLAKKGKFKKDDRIVCVTTGAGLKDPTTTLKILAEPPVIEPQLEEVDRILKGGLFAIRASGMVEREKFLFDGIPQLSTLKRVLKEEFALEPGELDLDFIKGELEEFREKGKRISKADMQAIVETALQQEAKKKYLEVIDFSIENRMHGQANALVKMKLNGQTYQSRGKGVGPVDAAINALREQLRHHQEVNFQLIDYNVEVTSMGTDASVIVTLVLKDKDDNQVVARQTSPDIVLASIEAFELGYNELVSKAKGRLKKQVKLKAKK